MIGIVTHYEVHNHGAQLQLFALIKEVEKKGFTAKALTFEKNYCYLDSSAKNKYKISIKSIPFYLKYYYTDINLKNKKGSCLLNNCLICKGYKTLVMAYILLHKP